MNDLSRDLYPRYGSDGESDHMRESVIVRSEAPTTDDSPAEVWCAKCDQPSVTTIETQLGSRSLCGIHAFSVSATSFNGGEPT